MEKKGVTRDFTSETVKTPGESEEEVYDHEEEEDEAEQFPDENFDIEEGEHVEAVEEGEQGSNWESLNDKEKKFYSKIFIEIVMDIGTQNRILNDIKRRLLYLITDNPCPTSCEEREIRGLKCCVKREMLRQECYMRKAREFLANAPAGPWDHIPIVPDSSCVCVPTRLCYEMNEAVCRDAEKKNRRTSSSF